MKILMVTPEFPPHCGGIGYYVFYLARELVARGLRVRIVVRGRASTRTQFQGVPAEYLSIKGIAPFNNGAFRRAIEEIVNAWRPDVVHVHASSLPLPRTNLPTLVTSHSTICTSTDLLYRPVHDMESLHRSLFFRWYVRAERELIRFCTKLTVVSPSMAEDYRRYYGVDSEVVWNGVDTEYFKPASENQSPKRQIVFVGALKLGKGVLDLLEAARLISLQRAEIPIRLYGDGPLRKTLEKKAKVYGLLQFKLAGKVSQPELPEILNNSAALVLPSYYEGLPNTLLEAMACGIPVIATGIKGSADLVKDGVTGYLVPPKVPQRLASAITKVLEDPESGRQMGRRGRDLVVGTFTWDLRAKQFVELYESLRH